MPKYYKECGWLPFGLGKVEADVAKCDTGTEQKDGKCVVNFDKEPDTFDGILYNRKWQGDKSGLITLYTPGMAKEQSAWIALCTDAETRSSALCQGDWDEIHLDSLATMDKATKHYKLEEAIDTVEKSLWCAAHPDIDEFNSIAFGNIECSELREKHSSFLDSNIECQDSTKIECSVRYMNWCIEHNG